MKNLIPLALGSATWSLTEYLVHRFAGHVYAKNRNFFAVEHVKHHRTTTYFSPNWKKLLAAGATAAAVGPVAVTVAGRSKGMAFTTGLVSAYLGYEWMHRRAHVAAPANSYEAWLRKHHFHHHFHAPHKNHGVTSPIWDKVFGTYEPPTRVRVPKRHAMPWLFVPGTDDLDPRFSEDYEVIDKKKKARSQTQGEPSSKAA